MSSSTSRFPARCNQCGHDFEVPDPRKAYSCRKCDGGRVLALPIDCISCGEQIAADDQYCPECGTSQIEDSVELEQTTEQTAEQATEQAQPSRGRVSSRRKPSGKARSTRRAVSSELNRAMKSVRALRAFFVLNALLHLAMTAIALTGFTDSGGDRSIYIVVLGVQASMAAIMLAGVFLVMHQPAVWALVMACLVTMSRALAAWSADWNFGVLGLGAFWALAFWALVAPAARAKRLMDENPDLAAAKKLQRDRPRAVRNASLAGGGVLLVSVSLAFFLHLGSAAKPLQPVWTTFVEDWNAGRNARVLETIEYGMSEPVRENFEIEMQARGWTGALPRLDEQEALEANALFELYSVDVRSSGSETILVATDAGDFEFEWDYRPDEHEWVLTQLRWPRAEFKDVIIQSLTGAWANHDLALLAGMFRDPERAERSLQRSFERRGWEREFPSVVSTSQEESSRGVFVYLKTDAGEMRFEFIRELGKWKISRFKLPERE